MTATGALRTLAAGVLLLVLASCAQRGGAGAAPRGSVPAPEERDRLVLQVSQTGGFVPPGTTYSRLPLVSVYADGRVISEGPVPAIHPGPALPNLQVRRIDPAEVPALVDRALAAGVAETADLGRPPIADAPITRFTVSAGSVHVREVYALLETSSSGPDPARPGEEPRRTGLTPEQEAARAKLSGLLDALTALGTTPDGAGAEEPYEPTAVAAVVTPWNEPHEAEPVQPDRRWPGPPLPGSVLDQRLGVSCVTAEGAAARSVLDAAGTADALTPWVAEDGSRWWVTFRPLLPHETGCADLRDS